MAIPFVGQRKTAEQFRQYLDSLQFTVFLPTFVTLHHTASPSLAQRPNGFSQQHLQNLLDYYQNQLEWSGAPHLFIDDQQDAVSVQRVREPGAVIVAKTNMSEFAFSGVGLNPHYGDLDPYAMAAAAIDEAVRNVVAVGAGPSRIAILDNFCWGNTDRPEVLGSLVRAAEACRDMALALGAPFISGKDSFNNEFRAPDRHIVIPPTLLISALGRVPDLAAGPVHLVDQAAEVVPAAVRAREVEWLPVRGQLERGAHGLLEDPVHVDLRARVVVARRDVVPARVERSPGHRPYEVLAVPEVGHCLVRGVQPQRVVLELRLAMTRLADDHLPAALAALDPRLDGDGPGRVERVRIGHADVAAERLPRFARNSRRAALCHNRFAVAFPPGTLDLLAIPTDRRSHGGPEQHPGSPRDSPGRA